MSIVLDIYVLSCLRCFVVMYPIQPFGCNMSKRMLLLHYCYYLLTSEKITVHCKKRNLITHVCYKVGLLLPLWLFYLHQQV